MTISAKRYHLSEKGDILNYLFEDFCMDFENPNIKKHLTVNSFFDLTNSLS